VLHVPFFVMAVGFNERKDPWWFSLAMQWDFFLFRSHITGSKQSQKLIRGLKRIARFYAPKYSKLINIFLIPYLVTRSSIPNGGLVAKQTDHEISLILSRF